MRWMLEQVVKSDQWEQSLVTVSSRESERGWTRRSMGAMDDEETEEVGPSGFEVGL